MALPFDPRQQPPTGPPMAPPMGGMATQDPNVGQLVTSQLGIPGGTPPPGPPPGMANPNDFGDPVLSQMMAQAPTRYDPIAMLPDNQKPGYVPPMDDGVWLVVAAQDQQRHRLLIDRMSRDLMLYRQRRSAKPPGFDPKVEIAFQSATISNIVNKLTNMSAPQDGRYEVPFKDETSKQASQIMENAYTYWRTCQEIGYSTDGGDASLAWDEYFYDYLYGRICARILPKPANRHFPFDFQLIDPATVYPVFTPGEGLIRLTHRRNMAAIDVLTSYLPADVNLTERVQSAVGEKFGYDSQEYRRFFYMEQELVEGYDTWNQFASWGGITLVNKPHMMGYIPYVYVKAKGEPRGMTTPNNRYWDDSNMEDPDPDLYINVSDAEDLAEKGVSVFHHLIRSNRMTEMVYTLLMTEVLKAGNPSTITYSAPVEGGKPPQPLRNKPGGNNQRTMNTQRVEIVPTSPHPTDVSPVLSKLTGDITEGSINPAMYGAVEGSNIAGFAIESMIAASKDTVLPYLRCYEIYRQQCASMMARQYKEIILPSQVQLIPTDGKYGEGGAEGLTPQVLDQAGTKVTYEIIGVSDQQLPAMVNAVGQAIERGLWSRRKGMEKLGEKDPARMIQDIIIERALEHPEMMENFLIPVNFIRAGQKDLADLWVLMVVMPKIQQLMMQMMGPAAQGAMAGISAAGAAPGGGGPPNPMAMLGGGGPAPNGQSNPMAGRARGAPTGPLPGQGRGAAPAPQPAMR